MDHGVICSRPANHPRDHLLVESSRGRLDEQFHCGIEANGLFALWFMRRPGECADAP